MPKPSCLRLLMQYDWAALDLALERAGRSIPARIAMIAITTSNSIRVNANRYPVPFLTCAVFILCLGYRRFSSMQTQRQTNLAIFQHLQNARAGSTTRRSNGNIVA